jgi:hypothetical protein
MKHLLALFLILFQATCHAQVMQQLLANAGTPAVAPSTPTLVQMKQTPSDIQAQTGISAIPATGNLIVSCLPNTTQTGNTIIAHLRTSEATIADIVLSDDGSTSNTYTERVSEVAGARTNVVFTAPVTHTSRCVTVTFNDSAGDQTDNLLDVYEFSNVGAFDVSCSGTATTGTAPACSSSMTPTVTGDLVMTFADVVSFGTKPTGAMTFTAQTGTTPTYTKLHSDGTSWSASQYGIYSGTSAITPSMTISTATTRANVVGIAMEAASGGGTFSGIHVYNVKSFAPQFANSTSSTATSQAVEIPCFGNSEWLLVGQGASSSTSNVTGITDTNSNTWTATGNVFSSGDGFAVQWWHTGTATCSGTEKATIAFTAAPTFLTVVAVDIANATGIDTGISCTGLATNQCPINIANSTATATFAGAVMTPSTSTGVALSYQNQDFQTIGPGSTPGNWVNSYESCPNAVGATGCTGNGIGTYKALGYVGSGFEQDDGVIVDYYTSTSAITFSWVVAQTQGSTNSGELGPAFSTTVAVKQ